jgi:5-methyltetrahydrofolate--homocysteine methyltransferase
VARVVIGTVKGDLHDIGKNLVASMLEGGGFGVVDLGANVAPEAFVEAVEKNRADIVALSALLTVTMPAMRTTIDALRNAGLRDRVKVMVGGAPVTRQFADEIGADGFSENANSAVALARSLVVARAAQ